MASIRGSLLNGDGELSAIGLEGHCNVQKLKIGLRFMNLISPQLQSDLPKRLVLPFLVTPFK